MLLKPQVSSGVILTVPEAFSGVFGYCSLACWILLVLPQFVTNHRNRSAEAISLQFITIWQIGHIASLIGALWAGLIPTIVLIEGYFCIANGILIGQCIYYKKADLRKLEDIEAVSPQLVSPSSDGDRVSEPLLQRNEQETTTDGGSTLVFQNTIIVLGVMTIGTAAWAVSYRLGMWKPSPTYLNHDQERIVVEAELLGYFCAITFLSARIPQMIKNAKRKSCQGLSIPFFMLALLGNLTYAMSILCHSTDKRYVIKNIPWIVGSLGTMGQDVVILAQFYAYRQ